MGIAEVIRMNTDGFDICFVDSDVDEFYELLSVFTEVFEEDNAVYPDRAYLKNLLDSKCLVVIVAKANCKIIAGLTAYVLPSYQVSASNIYIYDLGVKECFRNKGIGRMLINYLLEYSKSNNIKEIFVDTEQVDNEEAIAFYNKIGFCIKTKVWQYTLKN